MSAPARVAVTVWHICGGSRPRADRLLAGHLVGQAGAGDRSGQVNHRARRSGQIRPESHRGRRHQAWWSSTREHRNDTHRSGRRGSFGVGYCRGRGLVRAACHPHRHLPDQAAPSFTSLLRQTSGGGLSRPLEQSAPHGARAGSPRWGSRWPCAG